MQIKKRQRLSENLVESIMLSRGIKDILKYINPTTEDDTDLSKLPNLKETISMMTKNISKDILILVDSDADGNTAAAIMYKYIKFVNPFAKVRYFIHEHKTHGLTQDFMQHVIDTRPDFVIVPDAGTNDIPQREEITSLGIDLLVIDHHNEDRHTDKGGILINNHAKFPENDINKNMTGAGMTYLLCKALDKFVFNTNKVDSLKDLAMVGIIGDCASLFDNETRYLCMSALKDIQSKMIQTVITENKQDINNVTFTNMQWGGIIPLINSIVRIGTLEEKELMFKALADIETDYFKIVQKRKLNKETRKYEKIDFKFNIYQLAADAARTCRDRQNKIIAKELEDADSKFNKDTGIQIYVIESEECKVLTGLVANRLTSLYQQPVLAVWELDGKYTGSLRGWEKTIRSFKKWCESTGLFELVQGHDNAAGVVFEKENLEKILEKAKHVEHEEFYHEVDELYNGKANMTDIFEIHNNKEIFKNGVTEPMFAVTNMEITPTNAKWSKNTMRIYIDGITYIKFKTPEDEFLELLESGNKIDIIGTFLVNEWNGREFPQMMISEYEQVETDDTVVNFGIFA